MDFSKISKITLFLGAIVFLAIAQGCPRFGNRVEEALKEDSRTGYYETLPTSIQYCADRSTQCGSEENGVPNHLLSHIFTNPVLFAVNCLKDGSACILDKKSEAGALPVAIDSQNRLSSTRYTVPRTARFDQACYRYQKITFAGELQTHLTQFNSGSSLPIEGRVLADIYIEEYFEGECEATLREFADCFSNQQNCGGTSEIENRTRYESAHTLFDPYVVSGGLAPSEIANVRTLYFRLKYR